MKLFLRLGSALGVVTAAALVAAACGSTVGPAVGITYTDLYVDPSSFRGTLACGVGAGTMRSYVVTLFDVTAIVVDGGSSSDGSAGASGSAGAGGSPGAGGSADAGSPAGAEGPLQCGGAGTPPGFRLPSSAPTACTLRTLMASVVPGYAYIAAVDAYPLPPCDAVHKTACLTPRGGFGSGSPIMEDEAGNVVPPLAGTCCGKASFDPASADPGDAGAPEAGPLALTNGPTVAIAVAQIPVRGCAPLHLAPVPSMVVVSTTALAGALGCAVPGPGAIGHVSISAAGNADSDVACGQDVTLASVAGHELSISVFAYAPDAQAPEWGTTCTAAPPSGATAQATCDPLSTTGTLRVDPGAALAVSMSACGAGVSTLEAMAIGGSKTTGALPCGKALAISGLSPGLHAVQVIARDAAGKTVSTVTCSGTVTPGHFADATCTSGV